MSVSIYLKGYYEALCGFGRRKNKAKTKPNKANLLSFSVLRSGKTAAFVLPILDRLSHERAGQDDRLLAMWLLWYAVNTTCKNP